MKARAVRSAIALVTGAGLTVALLWLLGGQPIQVTAAEAPRAYLSKAERSSLEQPARQPQQAPGGAADHVVISEIQIDGTEGTGGADDDWVELYNPTDQDIDLAAGGYRLERWSGSGTRYVVVRFDEAGDAIFRGRGATPTTIPARGFYLVVGRYASGVLRTIADAMVTGSFVLDDNYAVGFGTGPMTDGAADEDTVDLVGWGLPIVSEGASATSPMEGGSIERKAQRTSTQEAMQAGDDASRGNSYDSDHNAQDFLLRDADDPQNSASDREIPFGSPVTVTVTAEPAAVTADGSSRCVITAVVSDTGGYVADGTVVTFATSLGTLGSSSTTEATKTGFATATLTAGIEAGVATVTATADAVSDATNVTLEAGPASIVAVGVDSSVISCGVTTTVRVTVTDEYGNLVGDGTPVTLTTDLEVELDPSTGTTEDGVFSAVVRGDKKGSGTITATVGNVSDTVGLTVMRSEPGRVTVAASPAAIVADGVDTSAITATVEDACGNPVPGTTVVVSTSLGSLGSSVVTRTTDGAGVATAVLTGTEAGVATIIAWVGEISRTAEVALLGGPPGALTMTVDSSVISCTVTTTLRVTVTDGFGNLVADGTPVTLTTDLGVQLDPSTGTTEGGLFSAVVGGDKVGTGTIAATTTGSVSDTVGLTVTAGDRSSVWVEAFPATIAADGVDSSTITATVKDACGNPVPGTTVVVSTSLGSLGSSVVTRTTDAAGVVTAALTGTQAGLATVTAAADRVSGTVELALVAGPPGKVTIGVDSSVISCGVTTTVRVTVTDAYGNAVADGTAVSLTTDLEAEIEPLAGTTEGGLFTATVYGEEVESGAITATTGNVSGTVGLTVTHGVPHSVTLAAFPRRILADRLESSVITATLEDACGNAVPEAAVVFTTSLGSLGSSVVTKTTDVNGVVTATLRGSQGGVATITAAVGAASATTAVDFIGLFTVCLSGCEYDTIQAAVDAASDGDQIRVAAGTYTGVSARAGLTQVVYISKTVTIRGGYTTTNWTTSNPLSNPTTLDAEGRGRVLYVTGDITPTIEGLRITGGDAAALGGGDSGYDAGGGVYVDGASATIRDCRVFSNTAGFGAGLYLRQSGTTLMASTVEENRALPADSGVGGGVYLKYSPAVLSDTVIAHNSAGYGGGVFAFFGDQARLANSVVAHNEAQYFGGGVYVSWGRPLVSGSEIFGNRAERGGGLAVRMSSAALDDNVVSGNSAALGGGVYLNNRADVYLEDGAAEVSKNAVLRNVASDSGGGLYLHDSAATLDGNTIYSNTAVGNGGGVHLLNSHAAALWGNSITANSADRGGGLHLEGSDATVVNTVVVHNSAQTSGSGIAVLGGAPRLLHTTLARNASAEAVPAEAAGLRSADPVERTARGAGDGRGIYVATGSVALTNTIIVAHPTGIEVANGAEVCMEGTLWGSRDWANGTDWAGAGLVHHNADYRGDPAFVAPDVGDYHIKKASAARDCGVNAGVAIDMDGDPRPVGAGVDLGADEWAEPDLSGSHKGASSDEVDVGDVMTFTIVLRNSGFPTSTDTTLFDAIPAHTRYVAGSARASSGALTEAGAISGSLVYSGGIAWAGSIAPGDAVTITFPVLVDERAFIENTAIVTESSGTVTTLTAQANGWRTYLPLVLKQVDGPVLRKRERPVLRRLDSSESKGPS